MPAPLNDKSSEAEWEAKAKELGITVSDLKEQIRLADLFLEEFFKEERNEQE